jgi:opacity protein-like surface antigen
MISCKYVTLLAAVTALMIHALPARAVETGISQYAQLKAGGYFPAAKDFEVGTGFDIAYSVKPYRYVSFETTLGYYRADKINSNSVFISSIPITVSALAILPLSSINLHAGGGIGAYFDMASGMAGDPQITTDMPSDASEFNFGYHGTAGVEFLTPGSLSMVIDYKYAYIDQGKFKNYDIKHGGSFLYGGFVLNF